MEMKEVTSIDE